VEISTASFVSATSSAGEPGVAVEGSPTGRRASAEIAQQIVEVAAEAFERIEIASSPENGRG
jgi:hypothetical protein